MNTKEKRKIAPSTELSFRYSLIALIITLFLMLLIPTILNYGPESINTNFDIQMSGISYNTQFLLIIFAIILVIVLLTKFLLKDIDKWSKTKKATPTEIRKIRKKCLQLPYTFFAIETLIPFLASVIILSITGSHYPIMILKIVLLLLSFTTLLAVISFVFSKNLYDKILAETYSSNIKLEKSINLKGRLFLLITSLFAVGILFTSLIGYSSSVADLSNTLFKTYNHILTETFDTNTIYTIDELIIKLENIDSITENETKFILNDNNQITIVSGHSISNFVIEYTKQISSKYNGRLYDSYGLDTQGASLKLKTTSGEYYIGILYDIYSETTLNNLINTFIFLIIIISTIILILINSISKDLTQISDGFENIINQTHTSKELPVISNDEIGNLVIAFNKIQQLNQTQIETIQNNQNTLIERERLASLGQMVGGIAHNLKTPIFSISGGLEGLSDLITEFDESIEDSNVTDQDMHEIAKDMRNWITKLKGHTSYMSDVITAVKGQAVNLSEEQAIDFTVSELFQHIKILMQHEIKHSLSTLNITNNTTDSIQIHGSINSLVQVINNLISNSIESYGKNHTEKVINLSANYEEKTNSVIISVQDFGPGLPDNVKEKLFKEMITTKGKDGTGLGLFMSYSNIKAHFKGDLTFETETNKGTTFYIKIPI